MGRFEELERLFEEARQLSPNDREQFVASVRDPIVRAELRQLLVSDGIADTAGFMDTGHPTPSPNLPQPGDKIGDFFIIRELGRGGMGVVFLAQDEVLEREVALKVLHPLLWTDDEARKELLHEARMIARVEHEAIIPLYRQVEADGWTLLVYRFIDGCSLSDETQRFHEIGTSPRWRQREDIVRELLPIAKALAYAHENGVWHRDIKPSNILLKKKSHAFLGDFGLAKDSLDPQITRSGMFKGSIPYMSPEQARARLQEVDHRSDIFSFGVVLFESLTSRHPFAEEQGPELLERIAHGQPKLLTDVWSSAPKSLTAICHKALRNERAERYESAQELADDLEAYLDGRPTQARLPNFVDKTIVAARRLTYPAVAVLVLLMVLFVGQRLGGRDDLTPVTVTSDPPAEEIWLREYDIHTSKYGDARRIGEAEAQVDLVPGTYRFIAIDDSGRFVELTRIVYTPGDERSPLSVHATIDSEAATNAERMVYIPGGRFIAGVEGHFPQYDKTETEVAPFWIDEYEVTNIEYRAFVDATNRRHPSLWDGQDFDTIADRPVVTIGWDDARAYAEWVGKRLPTRLEWERAARAADGRIMPWGSDTIDLAEVRERACVGRLRPEDAELVGTNRDYVLRCCPVGTHPMDVSPDGVFDMLGGVSEWVDSRPASWIDDELRPIESEQMAKGLNWKLAIPGIGLQNLMTLPGQSGLGNPTIGFRCARSGEPPSDPREGESRAVDDE